MKQSIAWLLTVAVLLLAGGCETVPRTDPVMDAVRLGQVSVEPPEDQLLDVAIEVFDPGPLDIQEAQERGIYPEIRRAEARFIPVHLKHTLQKSGYWGAVRVVPPGADHLDVFVQGQIQASDGEVLTVRIDARDASGRRWFSKFYETRIWSRYYEGNRRGVKDAFQDFYNTVANDLAAYRARLSPDEARNVRRISELRFANALVPDAFPGYLTRTEKGILEVNRLPARDDPMIKRVRRIRERDNLLIDTLNGHYEHFYADMWTPYENWRKYRNEEAEALREVKNEATKRKLLGVAAIAGAVALGIMGNSSECVTSGGTTRCRGTNLSGVSTVMAAGGAYALKSGFDKAAEAGIHEDAIQELGASFDAEVKPLIVEVEGETVELTGSAEAQYAEWRALLRRIYATETGFAADVNIVTGGGEAGRPRPDE